MIKNREILQSVLSEFDQSSLDILGPAKVNAILDAAVNGDQRNHYQRTNATGKLDLLPIIDTVSAVASVALAIIAIHLHQKRDANPVVEITLDSIAIPERAKSLDRVTLQRIHALVTIELQRRQTK